MDLLPMSTNEENIIKSLRRIPLNYRTIFKELIGNMKGNIIKFFLNENQLIFYNKDGGFSENDKDALIVKYQSGDINDTAGLNGLGCVLSIDRILSEGDNSYANIYSLNDKKKCQIGHFKFSPWTNMSDNDINENIDIDWNHGSLFIVPLNEEYNDIIKNNKEDILKTCLKCLNIKIADNNIDFYWNGEIKRIEKICPDEGSILIDYSLGYDTNTENNRKKPLYLKINNYDSIPENIKNKIPEICHIKRTDFSLNNHEMVHNFFEIDSGKLKINIISEEDSNIGNFNVEDVDGMQIYMNNININDKAIVKNLGGRTSAGTFGCDIYNGKPRFENHIEKKTPQYNLPQDKSNTQPTEIGAMVLRYVQKVAKKIFLSIQTENQSEEPIIHELHNQHELPNEPDSTNEPNESYHHLGLEVNSEQEEVEENFLQEESEYSEGLVINEEDHQEIESNQSDEYTSRNIPNSLKKEIWKIANDNKFEGECFCCRRNIAPWDTGMSAVEFGHREPWSANNENNIKNIVPICMGCNRSMGNTNMDEWMEEKYSANMDYYNQRWENYLRQ
jgi:hypothetical protein